MVLIKKTLKIKKPRDCKGSTGKGSLVFKKNRIIKSFRFPWDFLVLVVSNVQQTYIFGINKYVIWWKYWIDYRCAPLGSFLKRHEVIYKALVFPVLFWEQYFHNNTTWLTKLIIVLIRNQTTYPLIALAELSTKFLTIR